MEKDGWHQDQGRISKVEKQKQPLKSSLNEDIKATLEIQERFRSSQYSQEQPTPDGGMKVQGARPQHIPLA